MTSHFSIKVSRALKELGVEDRRLRTEFWWASYMRHKNTGGGFKRVDDVWQLDPWGSVNGGKNPTRAPVFPAHTFTDIIALMPKIGEVVGWGGVGMNEDNGKIEFFHAVRCPRDGEWLVGELQECPNECDYDGSEIDALHGNYEYQHVAHLLLDALMEGGMEGAEKELLKILTKT